jgi:hypothetical protein
MKLLLYSFLLILAPCNAAKKTSSSESADPVSKVKPMVIVYEKTACFGKCPVFTMTINSETKLVTFKGAMNVDKLGIYEKNISEDELKKLSDGFETYKFFEMQDEYNSQMTDIPSKYITYTLEGKTKKVRDRYNAPPELKSLEKLLDAIAESDDWKKIKDPE